MCREKVFFFFPLIGTLFLSIFEGKSFTIFLCLCMGLTWVKDVSNVAVNAVLCALFYDVIREMCGNPTEMCIKMCLD